MSALVNILYNVIKSRVPVMSLQCRRLLLSPRKLHPPFGREGPKNDRLKKLFVLDICNTHDPDTTEKIQFYPICCFFPLFVF